MGPSVHVINFYSCVFGFRRVFGLVSNKGQTVLSYILPVNFTP